MDAQTRTDLEQREQAAKPRRKPGSFVLKLTFGQSMRMFRLMLTVDVLVVLVSAFLLLLDLEHTVKELSELTPEEVAGADLYYPELEVSLGQEPYHRGVTLPEQAVDSLRLTEEASRLVIIEHDAETVFLRRWNIRPVYIVSVPVEGGYLQYRFDLTGRVEIFCYAMMVVLAVELLMLINNTVGTRRAVRRTLAPIQQLAAATRNISSGSAGVSFVNIRRPEKAEKDPDAVKAVKEETVTPGKTAKYTRYRSRKGQKNQKGQNKPTWKAEELRLSGTIDTLNKITADDLGMRISIDGERAELRGLAGAINGMLDRLDAAYSSQLRFVSDASHELRTPIAVLQGYANMLDRWGKEDPAVLQESIEAIKAEAEGMKVLVEQLLFLARGDNNTIAMQVHPLDASEFAGEVLRETQLIDKNHEFESDIQKTLWVEGDSGLLKQALRIFVDNAVKYSPEGGVIRISARERDGWVRVSVTDSGIGIPEEDLPHVFERFFRSDESRARATGGTGLGLSIAHWIVERHGGFMEIVSRQEIGTRLTMVLPTAEVLPEDLDGEETAG